MNRAGRVPAVVAVVLFQWCALTTWAENPDLRVSDAWVRQGPPVAVMLAGYLTLENLSAESVSIVGGTSPSFAQVQIHRTEVNDGVARMLRQDRVDVAAGDTLAFKPGGLHLMLMKPVERLDVGDIVEIVLELDDGRSVAVTATVRQ